MTYVVRCLKAERDILQKQQKANYKKKLKK